MSPAPFKQCSCGRCFTAAQWAALPKLKPWPNMTHDDGTPYTLESANCSCGSTMAVEVPAHAEAALRRLS